MPVKIGVFHAQLEALLQSQAGPVQEHTDNPEDVMQPLKHRNDFVASGGCNGASG